MTAPASRESSIVRLDRVDSTQAAAFALAEQGAPEGTVVAADHQSAGRGRRGRPWHAEPGESLLVSIVLRPRRPVAALPVLSLVAAVAVAEALAAAGVRARVKWPNDVLAGGRKIAGILLETRLNAGGGEWEREDPGRAGAPQGLSPGAAGASPRSASPVLILGIGVNIAQRAFPPDLAGRATSVALETGRPADREALLAALLDAFDRWRGRLEREGVGPVRERWLALAETIGRTVTVDGVTGVAEDLDGDGALLIRDGAALRRVVAGEVADAPGR